MSSGTQFNDREFKSWTLWMFFSCETCHVSITRQNLSTSFAAHVRIKTNISKCLCIAYKILMFSEAEICPDRTNYCRPSTTSSLAKPLVHSRTAESAPASQVSPTPDLKKSDSDFKMVAIQKLSQFVDSDFASWSSKSYDFAWNEDDNLNCNFTKKTNGQNKKGKFQHFDNHKKTKIWTQIFLWNPSKDYALTVWATWLFLN